MKGRKKENGSLGDLYWVSGRGLIKENDHKILFKSIALDIATQYLDLNNIALTKKMLLHIPEC